jgi:uncharacterized protein
MKDIDQNFGPTREKDRLVSLDLLRGFAVLGILIMNIQSFSMIEAAYINPAAYGDLSGIHKWVWILSHLFADQKFMTIFSILFGAGILLMTGKIEAQKNSATGFHYRRTLWLLVIGMLHAYLLWHGDILVAYALCAMIVYFFRHLSARKLFIIGLAILGIPAVLYFIFGFFLPYWPTEAYEGNLLNWKPNAEMIAKEISIYQGSWIEQFPHRLQSAIQFQTFIFLIWYGWRAGGLMLLGMAFFKWGILTAEKTVRFYGILTIISFLIGLPVVIAGIISNFAADWFMDYSMFFGWHYNYWGSLFVSVGYIAVIMLIVKCNRLPHAIYPLTAVGRMAFTNYLLQTVICTLIFYGHGFGFFGQVERKTQVLIVIVVWIVQLILSPIWLHYFRFGPIEWLWRSLTYLKIQPVMVRQRSLES